MTPMTAEEYARYWSTLTGRNFDDVYIPIHLRDDQPMMTDSGLPPTFETWRESNREALALEQRDYAWFDDPDYEEEETLTNSGLTMGMAWTLLAIGYLIVGLVFVMVLK